MKWNVPPRLFSWKHTFFLGLIFLSLPAFSQSSSLDSLQRLIDAADSPTERQELAFTFAQTLYTTDADSAVALWESQINTVQAWEESNPQRLALDQLYDRLGQHYFRNRQPDIAQEWARKAVQLNRGKGDKRELQSLLKLGKSFFVMGQADSATFYFKKVLEGREDVLDSALEADVYINLAANAGRSLRPEEAIQYYQKAIPLLVGNKDTFQLSMVYSQTAASQYIQGDFRSAIESGLKGYELAVQKNLFQQKSLAASLLSDIYEILDDPENARLYLEKLIEFGLEDGQAPDHPFMDLYNGRIAYWDDDYEASLAYFQSSYEKVLPNGGWPFYGAYWNYGQAYEKLGELDSALKYFQAIYWKPIPERIPIDKIRCLIGIGSVQAKKGDVSAAESAYQDAYDQANAAGYPTQSMKAAKGLYSVLTQRGDSKQALFYLERASTLKDSILGDEKVRELAQLEAEHAMESERKAMLFQQEQEKLRQQNIRRILFLGLGALLLILGVGAYFLRASRKNNQELKAQKDLIETQKEKLEEMDNFKSRFFTNISHEFRTPLTVIAGMTDQMSQQPEKRSEKSLGMIQRNANSLLSLVNQILDLRKLESGSLTLSIVQADVVQFFRLGTSMFESMAESKQVGLSFQAEPQELWMDVDMEKLGQIQTNLISNAIKFTPAGGTVDLGLTSEGDQMLLTVADTGRGIPADKLPQIFDRFYQVDDSDTREGEGTGIGLALSKELVTVMQGELDVQSEVGKGTTFTLRLPISRQAPKQSLDQAEALLHPPAVESAPLPLAPTPTANGQDRPSLLIIEDNPDIVSYLYSCLEDQYELSSAGDGQAGIEAALEQVPDLIITDVMMPRKNGYEVVETLKLDERTSHIPIVMLTAKADQASRLEGYKRGADAYLPKPFDPAELDIRLAKLLELRNKLRARYQQGLEPAEPTEDPQVQQEDAFITQARQCILDQLENSQYRGDSLMKDLGLSRTNLHRKLKALTGLSTSHFIRAVRVEEAIKLLKEPDRPVSEIAYLTGFNDPNYFNRVFAEIHGQAPSDWRKENLV